MSRETKTLFISNCSDQLPFRNNSLSFFSCNYDVDRYHNLLFTQFNIDDQICLTPAIRKRRAEYLAGRICASRALSKLELENINVSSNTDRSPKWPTGIVGSITHTETTAAAIVAHNKIVSALGIDYENILSVVNANEIKDQIINSNENRNSYSVTHNLNIFVTLLFSAKECLYKALYPHVKIFLNFHDLTAIRVDTNTLTLRLCVDYGRWCKGVEIDIYYKIINNSILTLARIEN